MTFFEWILGGALLGGIFTLFRRWSKRSDETTDARFRELVFECAASWFHERDGGELREHVSAVATLLSVPTQSKLHAEVLRIDYSLERAVGSNVLLGVDLLVAREGESNATKAHVEQELPWDDVPQPLRAQLIRQGIGKEPLVFRLYDRPAPSTQEANS